MNELEKLVNEKVSCLAILDRVNKEIESKQILREGHMKMFGFERLTEGNAISIYGKKSEWGAIYEVLLDLTKPNLVTIRRERQEKTYGFEIDSVQEFKDLLIFINL